MCKALVMLLMMVSSILFGDVTDYLKKIECKDQKKYTMRNIDFIYMINLDQRPKKFEMCKRQLNRYGIEPFRFSAVNGWELSHAAINDVGVKFAPGMEGGKWGTSYLSGAKGDFKPTHGIVSQYGRTYFCHCMSRGAIGILLSHLSILEDAYKKGYKTIWVMEDDIQVIQDPRVLPKLIDKLDAQVGKKNWDILFTDRDTKDQQGNYVQCLGYAWRPNFTPANPERFARHTEIGKDFIKIGARYGAYSMILRRSGIKKILKFLKKYIKIAKSCK